MSYSKLYYALLGVSFAGFIGSCYKLYKLFSGKEQFIEEVSLIEDNSISSEIKSDALTIEKALKLIAILKTKTEDYLNEKCPNIINLRRYYLKIDEEQYLVRLNKLFAEKATTLKQEKNSFVKKKKIMNYLQQKGYESSLISDLLKEM